MQDKDTNPEASGVTLEEGQLVYEFAYHLLPTMGEDEVSKEVEAFKDLIKKSGGNLLADEAPTSMDLAYTMIKKQEGKNAKFDTSLFGWIKFVMEGEGIATIEEELKLNKQILRYIIIKTVAEYQPIQHKQLFKEVETPEPKPIAKPQVEEKIEDAKPISEEELDKTIEELVNVEEEAPKAEAPTEETKEEK